MKLKSGTMLFNYLKISFRSIRKNKLFSFINVFGLAFSLSVCLIIIMLLADQYSYDRHNVHIDQTYRINYNTPDMEMIVDGMATSPMPLGEQLTKDFTGVEDYTRLMRGFGNSWVKLMQDVNIPLSGFYADPNVFDVFQYEFEHGDKENALVEPYSVVLSKETAEKLFNKENPIGEVIKVGELGSYKVTGVLKRMEGKSHIKFDGLASMSTIPTLVKQDIFPDVMESWENRTRGWTYIRLESGFPVSQVENQLAEISTAQYADLEDMQTDFYLQNIGEISPGPMVGNQIGPGIPMIFVYFLAGMALVIIISACFNYTNLSIARSLSRSKEVGIRKVFGAVRYQVFLQFLVESILISLLAFLFSIGLVQMLEPVFQELNFSQLLDWNLNHSFTVYFLCLIFSMVVGAVAGILPAAFLSSVQAIQALNNLSGVKVFSKLGLRNSLIVGQFGLSLFLVITVQLIYNQMNFMIDKEYGFDADEIIVVRLNDASSELMKTELLSYANITNVSAAAFVPASGVSSETDLIINETEKTINYMEVDEDYVENMGLSLVAGAHFTKEINHQKMVINETALTHLEMTSALDAIGQVVVLEDSLNYEIVGVLKDYNHETLVSEIKPLALIYDEEEFNVLQVRIDAKNYEAAVQNLAAAWEKVNPGKKLDSKLMSDEIAFFANMMFGDLTKVVTFISLLAIIIACLGLMGMVVFNTHSRLKEISIRKVLGASNGALVYILSKGFVRLLTIAIVISVPITWFINNLWLDFIAFRVEIGLMEVSVGVLVIVCLGLIVVGSQTLKTANTNPSDVLRDE